MCRGVIAVVLNFLTQSGCGEVPTRPANRVFARDMPQCTEPQPGSDPTLQVRWEQQLIACEHRNNSDQEKKAATTPRVCLDCRKPPVSDALLMVGVS